MLAWLGQSLGSTLLLSIMLVLAFSGIGFLYYHRKQHRMVIAKTLNRPAELKTSSKIVKLTKEVQEAQKN